jgi:hypothetical protein
MAWRFAQNDDREGDATGDRAFLAEALARSKKMTELFSLGLEILFRVRTRRDFAGHALNHLDPGALERFNLVWIVGEQAHFGDAQRLENLARQGEVPVIGLESQSLVGFDRVQTRVLQLIRLQLGHKSDATAFLLLVNEDARAQISNHRESHFELLTAVAPQGMKNVPGQTLRVNSNQRRRGVNVTHHEGDSFLNPAVSVGTRFSPKTVDSELAPARGKIRGCELLKVVSGHCLIIAVVDGNRMLYHAGTRHGVISIDQIIPGRGNGR